MKILVLGASGMLGFALHRVLHDSGFAVVGAVRGQRPRSRWCYELEYVTGVDVEDISGVLRHVDSTEASVVINASGVRSADGTEAGYRRLFAVNSVFPRLLADAAVSRGFDLIHFSSDGVFSGGRGSYDERSRPDPVDCYGISKLLGEAANERVLVFRTSLLGRGIQSNDSLVDWFVKQSGCVRGFRRAVFSGLPVDEIARMIASKVLTRSDALTGLFHLGAAPISKFELLNLIRSAWALERITLQPDDDVITDRSLDCRLVRDMTGYVAADWPHLIENMRAFYGRLALRGER